MVTKWGAGEREVLIRLVYTHVFDIEYGEGKLTPDKVLRRRNAWEAIVKGFNASDKSKNKVSQCQLSCLVLVSFFPLSKIYDYQF